MRLDFGIYEFLTRMLPYHKRQENRLKLFDWPLEELRDLWNGYVSWRQNTAWESNTTGQKLSLETWLNKTVPNSGNAISITEVTDGGVMIGLLSEGQPDLNIGVKIEPTYFVSFPINGELQTSHDKDFQVNVPATVNIDFVKNIVDRYCIAGVDYEIVQA